MGGGVAAIFLIENIVGNYVSTYSALIINSVLVTLVFCVVAFPFALDRLHREQAVLKFRLIMSKKRN